MVTDPLIRLLGKCEWHGDCLLWTGQTVGTKSTYGMFRVGTRERDRRVYVHRYAYERMVGPIPEGLQVDHVRGRGCTSTLCVLPYHLEAVTSDENSRRARLALCRSGRHDLSLVENQRWDTRGRRRGCLACWKEKQKMRTRTRGGQ